MRLIPGDNPKGEFPGARDQQFTGHCLNSFFKELDEQRPRLVLGLELFHFLAQVSEDLKRWKKTMKLAEINAGGCSAMDSCAAHPHDPPVVRPTDPIKAPMAPPTARQHSQAWRSFG